MAKLSSLGPSVVILSDNLLRGFSWLVGWLIGWLILLWWVFFSLVLCWFLSVCVFVYLFVCFVLFFVFCHVHQYTWDNSRGVRTFLSICFLKAVPYN